MTRHFPFYGRSLEMTQRYAHFFVALFLFAVVVLDEQSSAFNITRYTAGDKFQNTFAASQSCNRHGAVCVSDENPPFCGKNCCYCKCEEQNPTYLLSQGNCTSENHLMSMLKSLNISQGCEHRMVISDTLTSHKLCSKELLPTLNTRGPGNTSLFLCSWHSIPGVHYKLAKNLLNCEILPRYSRYLDNGSWLNLSGPQHAGLKNLQMDIQKHPSFDDISTIVLKWTKDIGLQYDGHIFSLRVRCHGKGKVVNSCLHFKKSGSLTNMKPTYPSLTTKNMPAQSTSVHWTTPTVSAAFSTGATQQASTREMANVTSFQSHPHDNTLIVVLASLAGALFAVLACIFLLFISRKRRRRYQAKKGNTKASNPVYGRGASETMKLAPIGGNLDEEETPEYQPLVQNTKPRERIDSLPGYRALSMDQKNKQQQGTNRGIRSSNYLSLIKDNKEDERDYQGLVKERKALQSVEEEKIPDYQEIEERTDSEETLNRSHSSSLDIVSDYEEPPAIVRAKNNTNSHGLKRRKQLNDPSTAINDYDEPEGVIEISDHEDEHLPDANEATTHNLNFHDYFESEDSDEDSINHLEADNDVTADHDYDDPAD